MTKKDPFGDTVFVRIEIHHMGYGYNVKYYELDALKEMMANNDKGWIELELLRGSRIWVRQENISDITISTPQSREFEEENEW